jgi:hypothetical protein
MFRFNQKKANKEVDELKKLLAITKGVKTAKKSISSSFLREDVDMIGNSTEPVQSTAPPVDMPTPNVSDKTEEMKKVENAIENSTVISFGPEGDEQIVRGYISTVGNEEEDIKAVYFKYNSKETEPMIQTSKAVILTDDLAKGIQQISDYFKIWKGETEK